MCGILAGDGRASEGKYRGVAPECLLICGKVLDHRGGGNLKSLLEGLKWVMDMSSKYPIKILNISIEMESEENLDRNELKLLRQYMGVLWEKNILVVAAAGNRGPYPMTISPISESGNCICVGCHDGDYIGSGGKTCAEYSGRGPGRRDDDGNVKYISNPLKKPDIVAPGTDIISCNYKVVTRNGRWYHAYVAKSGTSMATPLVSGACALCLQKYPQMTNIQLYRKLLKTAKDLGESWNMQGAGLLRVRKLLEDIII